MKYRLSPSVAKIHAPIILVIDGTEQEFSSGTELSEASFDKHYVIDSLTIRDNKAVVTVKENVMTDINWIGEEPVSFF